MWTLVVADDALNPKAVRTLFFDVGVSIEDAVKDIFEDDELRKAASLTIADSPILEPMWAFVKPKENTVVTLIVHPEGRGVVALTAAIAGAVVGGLIGGPQGALAGYKFGTLIGGVAGAVAAFAVNYAGAALFGFNKQKKATEEAETFSLAGARNSAQPYGAVPVVLGTHKMVPPYVGQPYTDSFGQTQFLRFAVTWGYGPVEISDVKIGNTLLSNYEKVRQVDDLEGRKNNLGVYPEDVNQNTVSLTLNDDATTYSESTTELNTEELSVTLHFPQGLYNISKKKGSRRNESVDVIGEYRQVDDVGAWTTLFEETITSRINRPLRFTYDVADLTADQYDVRVKFASTPESGDRVFNTCIFETLRSITYQNPVDNDFEITKSAFRIKATDQLNGVVDELNAIVSTKIPTWNGSAWTTQTWTGSEYTGVSASSNPAAIYRYIHLGLAGGEALTSASMDDDGLGEWYQYCEDEGLTYNRVINFRTSIDEIRREVAAAGQASPDFVDGKWGVLIDKPKTTVVQHFTPRNTHSFTGGVNFAEVPHALRCRFANEDRDYQDDEAVVYADGFDSSNSTKFEVIEFGGHTTASANRKSAKRYLRSIRLRPEVFTFNTDFENLVATRGDLVRLTHDAALIGQQSGRITAISGNTITLDEPITMEVATSYGLRVRTQTNTSESVPVTLGVGTTNSIDIPSTTENDASIALMNVGDLFMFGEAGAESVECIISEIEHLDDLEATITCVPYSAGVYAQPGDDVDDYVSTIQLPVSKSFRGPPPPVINNVTSGENNLNKTSSGVPLPGMVVEFTPGVQPNAGNKNTQPTEFIQVRYRQNDGIKLYDSGGALLTDDPGGWSYSAQTPADTVYLTINDVEVLETYLLQARAISREGGTSDWVSYGTHTVLPNNGPPPQVNNLYLSTVGETTYLQWDYDDEPADLRAFEIRYSTTVGATVWNSMMVVASNIERETRQFTVPSRVGTYAIKAIDIVSQKSQAATFASTTKTEEDPKNVIHSSTQNPTFSGGKTNLVVNTTPDPDELQLDDTSGVFDTLGYYYYSYIDMDSKAGGNGVYTWTVRNDFTMGDSQDLDTMDKWTTLNGVLTLDNSSSVSDDVYVKAQIAYSEDDVAGGSATFTDWQDFVTGQYTARHFRFRLVLETEDTSITPQVSALSNEIIMFDRTTTGTGSGIVHPSTTATSINFSPAFRDTPTVMVNADDAQANYVQVTNVTRTGFDVRIRRTSDDNQTADSFTWTAVGYGSEKGT